MFRKVIVHGKSTGTVKNIPVQWRNYGGPGEHGKKEIMFLFNDALNTFYLRLYGRNGTIGTIINWHAVNQGGTKRGPS